MRKNTKKAKKKTAGGFFQTRMNALGVTPLNNKISSFNSEAEFPVPSVVEMPIFEEDNKGNICINFYDLDRQLIMYYKKGRGKLNAYLKKPHSYQQIRLQFPKGDMKYVLPRGQGIFPFHPPLIIEAWKKKTPIRTLYLTEGAFKAWKACLYGIYTVGLTSITHYRDSETRALHGDIIKLIIECQVQRVVILWDGDCRDISDKHLGGLDEIAKRPRGFFNAVKNIRKLLLDIELPEDRPPLNIQFFHVRPDSFPDLPKGLDDILIAGEKMGNIKNVVQELSDTTTVKSFYFYQLDITASTTTLLHYFKLHQVQAFFHFHHDKIQNTRFKFKKDFWAWNEESSQLEMIAPGWVENIKWVGDGFYQQLSVPTANGQKRQDLQLTKKQTLVDLYGLDFQKYLKHYQGFCNIPNHFDYQTEFGDYYNSYLPLLHTPEEGDCAITLDFIKHIFGDYTINHQGKSYSSYELGLDYLQILLTLPHRMLPVLILYSPENNTGKSTFGKWQQAILGGNAINITNSDLKSEFNAHWIKKLLIYCDETFLERKAEMEMIKAKSTACETTANAKGLNQYQTEFFGKFQFYSNNKKMVFLTKHDERYWIRRVPAPEQINPDLLDDLEEEIPAFLHFIKNRKLVTKRESRMHFHTDLIRTATFHEVVKINEPIEVQSLRENIKMMFLDFNQDEILLPIKAINLEFFGNNAPIPKLKEMLKDYLNVDQRRDANGVIKQVRGQYYRWERDINTIGEESNKKRTVKFNGRPYVFHRQDFIEQQEEFHPNRVSPQGGKQIKLPQVTDSQILLNMN